MQNSKVQTPIYSKETQTTYQSRKGIEDDGDIDEGWQPSGHNHKKSIDSTTQSTNYIDELGHILIHMVEKMRDEWISGYHDICMNGYNNTFEPLMNVNYFHMDVQENSHHELNGVKKMII